MFHLRDAFRAGDVWLARSRRYGDIRKALLSAPAVADADRSLPAPASPHDWLAERRTETAVRRTGPLTLVADLYRRMPAARPGELLAHVSPLGWEHINLTGEYRWPGADPSGTAKRLA